MQHSFRQDRLILQDRRLLFACVFLLSRRFGFFSCGNAELLFHRISRRNAETEAEQTEDFVKLSANPVHKNQTRIRLAVRGALRINRQSNNAVAPPDMSSKLS